MVKNFLYVVNIMNMRLAMICFKERVEHYRKTYNIDNNSDNKQVQKSNFFDIILDYIKSNVIYIVGGLVCVLFILIIVLVIRKKKNRRCFKLIG